MLALKIGGAAAVAATYALVYDKGRSDCARKFAEEAAEDAQEWSEKIETFSGNAYARGAEATRKAYEKRKTGEEILRDAKNDPNAGDRCFTGGFVDGLFDIRSDQPASDPAG